MNQQEGGEIMIAMQCTLLPESEGLMSVYLIRTRRLWVYSVHGLPQPTILHTAPMLYLLSWHAVWVGSYMYISSRQQCTQCTGILSVFKGVQFPRLFCLSFPGYVAQPYMSVFHFLQCLHVYV